MSGNVRLGRVAGLQVAVHWSIAVIAGLLAWSLAETVLPDAAPGYTTVAYWAAGLVGAAALLASLLAHELAHAVTARRAGVEVQDLTLWLFGGVAKLRSQPDTPGDDLRIAAAGPLTSLAMSLAFLVTASTLAGLGVGELIVAVVVWLAALNFVLALFNLLPGAPLDGGRVLRALLWRRHGDWTRAAVGAARAGQVVAYGVMWLGFIELLAGALGGLWLVLIGWFLLNASRAEQVDAVARHLLADVRVADAMSPDPAMAPAWVTVADFVDGYLLTHPHSAFPVEAANGRIVGLLTLRQLRAVPAAARTSTPIADIAIPLEDVPTAAPDDLLVTALGDDDRNATGGRILVFDGPRLVGIVTTTDIARLIEVHRAADLGTS